MTIWSHCAKLTDSYTTCSDLGKFKKSENSKQLKKIKTKDYSSKENLDLDKYFFESNKEKQDKQKDVILFTKILTEHILYGK